MPFLTPNKQRQSTEGTTSLHWFDPRPSDHNMTLAARCCAVAPATNIDQSINQREICMTPLFDTSRNANSSQW